MRGEYRRRNSLRYPGHDYSQPASVFVTIDAHEKQRLFGKVIDGHMSPSPAGVKAAALWRGIPERFPAIDIDAFVVMPDHIHGILFCGVAESSLKTTVGDVVRWFKSSLYAAYGAGVKREGWPPYNGKLWHRDYHDRIIRDDAEFETIRAYITANPVRWREKYGDDLD